MQLNKAPDFSKVRDVAGLIAADSAVINFTNFPLTLAFDPAGSPEVQFYWEATTTEAAVDRLSFEILELQGVTGSERLLGGAKVASVPPGTLVIVPVYGNNKVIIRVDAAAVTTSTRLLIWAAMASVP